MRTLLKLLFKTDIIWPLLFNHAAFWDISLSLNSYCTGIRWLVRSTYVVDGRFFLVTCFEGRGNCVLTHKLHATTIHGTNMHTIQAMRYNSLLVVPQNVPGFFFLTNFTLGPWKDFDVSLLLIGFVQGSKYQKIQKTWLWISLLFAS